MRNPFTLPQASLGEAENSRREHRIYPLMSDKSVTRLGRVNAVPDPVSYTHLDVYKRQRSASAFPAFLRRGYAYCGDGRTA